ncbi:uncharacterized protein LOC112034302 [Quercus suber]|uniref:uncharacterized protein LOC112034302 n=1 Tax=Quercus suber TaxID=58331 RepID=UPI000CE1FAC8|nr:uncharacterized protein LOC112034302 [Quercus suber]
MTQTSVLAETSHDTGQNRFWCQIWNLHIPNKIKLFTWKACKNILPTEANLYHRRVIEDPTYEAYVLALKIVGHLFWDCTVAKDVWNLLDIPFDKNGINHKDFMDFLWYLLFKQHMGTKLIELVITTTWSFKEATDGHWVPPMFPWYKVNVDAAAFSHLSMIGVGVIIRDHVGSIIAALSKHLPLPLGPLEAEAKALDEATIFVWDIRVRDVIFETDSTTVCHVIKSPTDAMISISTIVARTCSRLCEFRTFQSSHVGRQGN